jgi:hypothetical protein
MMHLVISCSSYLLFLAAKALIPTQQAAWRTKETHADHLTRA